MADVSIIEFLVYAIICYTGIVMLIISAFRETPFSKSQSGLRVIWVLPSIFCAFMLASAGQGIILDSETETVTSDYEALTSVDTVVTLNSTTVTTSVSSYMLLQPVWVTLHSLFFTVMIIYVLVNVLSGFIKRD